MFFFFKCFRKLSRAEYQNKLVANQQSGACLLMMQRRERLSLLMTDIMSRATTEDRDGR